jgi:MFS family permease
MSSHVKSENPAEAENQPKKADAFVLLAILSMAIISGGSGMLGGAINVIANAFPELPFTTIALVSTIVNIVACPVMLLTGAIVGKRIGFRPLALLGIALFTVGGSIPAVIAGNFAAIIVSRVIVAIGVGCVQSLPLTLAFRLFTGNKSQKVQSWSVAVNAIATSLLTMLVGFMATIAIDIIWLAHLLGAICLVLVFFGVPEPKKEELTSKVEDREESKPATRDKMPLPIWAFAIMSILAMAFVFPVYVGTSTILDANGWGDAAVAGVCIALSAMGCFFGGMIFSPIYLRLRRWTATVAAIIAAGGSVLMLTANGLIMFMIGIFINGMGYMQFFNVLTASTGELAPPSRVAIGMSLMMVTLNLGAFVSPYIVATVQSIMGTTSYLLPFAPFAVLWLVMGLLMSLWYPQNARKKSSLT